MATNDFERILNGQNSGGAYAIGQILGGYGGKLVHTDKDGNYEGGESPLFLAVKWKAPKSVLKAIIDYYPQDINKPDNFNTTPLALARQGGLTEAVNYLLERGAVDTAKGGRKRRRKTNKKRKTSKRRKTGKRRRR